MRTLILGLSALLLVGTASVVHAGDFDTDISIGYSRLRIDGSNAKNLDKSDGAAIQASFMFPASTGPGFRFGFSLEASGYYDDFHVTDSDDEEHHLFNEVALLVPELRVGYYVPIGNFFIEPSVGVGAAIGDYVQGHIHHHHHDDGDDDFSYVDDDTFRINAAIHPTLQIGYASNNHWAAGVQASYLYTHLHFKDGVGGDISEMYVGPFFRWTF